MKSWLSRTDSLPIKERNLGSTGTNLVMKIHLSGGMDTEAWRSLLQSYFFMFNSILGYKSETYKTEIHSLELKQLKSFE